MRLRLFSRRPPFPGEMRIACDPNGHGGIPVMFAKDKTNTALYSKKNIPFENVVPQVWDYATSDPHKERDYPFRGFFLGAGEAFQLSPQPTMRYSECKNVDPSLGFVVKAPHFHDATPGSTGWVADFVEGVHNGALTLFALCGRYTDRLQNDDTWTVSDDLGADKLGTQAVRFEGTGGGPIDAVYVANTGSKIRQYDGAAWHDGGVQGTAITKRREELWVGLGNTVRKCTADPTNAGDYAAAIPIGDESSAINWLSSVGTQLAIFKAESLYGLDVDLTTDTIAIIPIAENMVQRSAYNGVNAASWLGTELFAPIGGSLFRIDVQIAYSVPVQLDLNPVPLAFHQTLGGLNTGIPVATAGHNDWTLYVGQYNSATGHSYIGKYGSWVPPTLTGAPDYSFVKAFHPGVKEFLNKRITCMKIWGRAGENQRLWVGFSDGTIEYCWLPNQSPDTASESVTNGGKCFPADVLVDAPSGVLEGTKRAYSGDLVEITTASGKKLAGTPNHPILTNRGWVALGDLAEGDYVLSRRDSDFLYGPGENPNNADTPIGEIFRLLEDAGTTQRIVPGTALQFHGDGQQADVHVVAAPGLLLDTICPQASEHREQFLLTPANGGKRALPTKSTLRELIFGRRVAPHSSVGGQHDCFLGLRRHARIHKMASAGVPASNARTSHAVSNRRRVQSGDSSYFIAAFARGIELDHIVAVSRRSFVGDVYNLQTSDHTYLANGIVTHNCEFTLDAGYIRWPLFTAGFEAITKLFRGFSAFGPQLSDTNKVKQSYRTDNTGSYVDLPDEFTTAGQRVDIADTTIGTSLDCKTYLDNTSINDTPVVEGMALHHQLRPKETFEHEGAYDLGAAVPGRDGAVPILNSEKLRDAINVQMQSFGSVYCVMPDGTTQSLIIYDHGENTLSARIATGREWALPFKAVQFSSSIALGTYRRIKAWTYGQLKQIRYGGLGKL